MGKLLSGAQGAQGLQGLLEDPVFQAGLGILQANQSGGSGDYFGGALQGAARAGQFKDARAEREALEQERERQEELRKRLQEIYAPAQPGQAAGVPQQPVPGMPQAQGLPQIATGAPGQMTGTPPGFSSAPGTNAAPGAEDIAALMLQYGTPQQQQQALQQLSAGERFQAQLAQTESQFNQRLGLDRQRLQNQQSASATAPADVREWEYFNALSEGQKDEYLNLKRGGDRPSSTTEKRLYGFNDEAFKSRSNVERYNRLADQLVQVDPASGVIGSWTESLKRITGSEDAVTLLRKEWNSVRTSAALQNLPPGAASDRDIQVVMEQFLPENADPQTIATFMRGLSKVEDIKAQYNEFAADYISTNPNRGGVGLDRAWREHLAQQTADRQSQGLNPVTGQTAGGFSPKDQGLIDFWSNWQPQEAQ